MGSPRRSKTRILNLKKKLKKMAKLEKKEKNQTKRFFFNSFTYARALVNDHELADNLLLSFSYFFFLLYFKIFFFISTTNENLLVAQALFSYIFLLCSLVFFISFHFFNDFYFLQYQSTLCRLLFRRNRHLKPFLPLSCIPFVRLWVILKLQFALVLV